MKKFLVTMMALALTIAAQAQQYDGINTYTYDYGLCGPSAVVPLCSDSHSNCKVIKEVIKKDRSA